MLRHIKEILTEQLLEDDRFTNAFCEECEAITTIPGDCINPPETDCPTGFAVGEPLCVKAKAWQDIKAAINQAAEIAQEVVQA